MVRRTVLLALALIGCRLSAPRSPPGANEPGPDAPEVTLYGVRMQTFRGGEPFASGRAAKLSYRRATTEFVATEAQMRFPPREGGLRGPGGAASDVELRAPTLSGSLARQQVEGSGGVTLRSPSGLWAKTEKAFIDAAAGIATGSSPIEVRGRGYELNAKGFRFEFAEERFVFEGDVRSRFGGPR